MVFWVILGIAIGNLLLGFALAVFLNRRYQTLVLSSSPEGSSSQSLFSPPSGGQVPLEKEGIGRAASSSASADEVVESPQPTLRSSPWEPLPELAVPDSLLEEQEPPPMPEGPSEVAQVSSFGQENPPETTAPEKGQAVPSAEAAQVPQAQHPSSSEVAAVSSLEESPAEEAPSFGESHLSQEETSELKVAVQLPAEEAKESADILPMQVGGDRRLAEDQPSDSMAKPKPSSPETASGDSEQPGEGVRFSPQEPAGGPNAIPKPAGEDSADRQAPTTSAEGRASQSSATVSKISGEGSGVSAATAGMVLPSSDQETTPLENPQRPGVPPISSANGPEASLERALAQWQAEAARYFAELSRTRAKVQRFSGAAKMEEIHTSWQEIHRAGQDYLATARPVRDAFGQFANLRSPIASVRDHLNTLSAKEETLIELTQELIPTATEAADTHLLCQQLLQHTDRLMEANRKVQTALEAARRGPTDQTPPAEASGRSRPGSGLLLDDSMREKVAAWWNEQRMHTHRLSLIMLEVDDFAEIQEEFGPSLTEGLLRAIERLLALESGEGGFLVPLSGPRFGLFCANRSLDQAVVVAEHLRQTLMATRFYRKKAELRISVSCGVTEATQDDTHETILERAEVALLQARRYGKARTFSHDGYFPMPVPGHPLAISPKKMEI